MYKVKDWLLQFQKHLKVTQYNFPIYKTTAVFRSDTLNFAINFTAML